MTATIHKAGYRASMAAFFATVLFVVVQGLQLMRVLHYPADEIAIYGFSLCIVIPFLVAMLALHYTCTPVKRFWSHGALIFTILYAVFASANYVVQLATVIPARLRGEQQEIAVLVQTPHSLFWDFDAMAYIFMGLATLFALPVFEKKGNQRKVRVAFRANAWVTPLIAFVYFYPTYSETLLLLGLPWAFTAPWAMWALAMYFRSHFRYVNTGGSVDVRKQQDRGNV